MLEGILSNGRGRGRQNSAIKIILQCNIILRKIGFMNERQVEHSKCPVCFKLLLVKYSNRNKPYLICNECGMQLFIRGEKARKLFAKQVITGDFQGEAAGMLSDREYCESLEKELKGLEEKYYFGQIEENNYKMIKANMEEKLRKAKNVLSERGGNVG